MTYSKIVPSLDEVNTDLVSKKTTLKNSYGIFELEEHEKNVDGIYEFLYNVNLKLKDLKPDVAVEIIRAVTPFFEDPVSPQLILFPNKTDDE